MKDLMKTLTIALAMGSLALLGACDSDDGGSTTTDTSADTSVGEDTSTTEDTSTSEDTSTTEDTTQAGTYATLVFTIDDSANQTYEASDGLAWKGSFSYDADTEELTLDSAWGGPFPMLYDDGTHGDATAGDHIWTVAVKVATPDSDLTFEYGAIRGSVDGSDGEWIWNGPNGTVTVPAGETGTVTATGLVIEPFGTIDLKLTIDVSNSGANLDPLFQGTDYTDVKVKGSAWGWVEKPMVDDGTQTDETADDGVYTFQLSENLGKHDGLLKPGQIAQFVFVLDGIEYKASGVPPATGVKAYLDYGDGFVEATIQNLPDGDQNTYVQPEETVTAFTPPADHVAVNFCIDDTANQTYEAGDGLAWKGSFNYDADTRITTFAGDWSGPYPMLYDDGPWDQGGHEPAGATAGDHIWCTTVWISNAAEQAFEYGAIRGSVDGSDGEWIWVGPNGSFTVTAGSTDPIDAQGMTIPAFGTIDLKLTIDLSNEGANLAAAFQSTTYTTMTVKGSAWAWSEVGLVDDGTKGDETAGDGIYTFQLGENLGKHDGKLHSGDKPEFVFVLDGIEYKTGGSAASEGVMAYLDDGAGNFSAATIETNPDNGNTFVTVP